MFKKINQALPKNQRPAALASSKHLTPRITLPTNSAKATHTMHYAELPDLLFSHEVIDAESRKKPVDEHHPANLTW